MAEVKTQKIAIVTGGTSGIGKAVCELFASKGCLVYSLSRRVKGVMGKPVKNGRIEYRTCDVTNEESIKKAFQGINHIDYMIHIAGFGIGGSCEMVSNADAHLQMETNFFGVLNVNRVALPIMRAQKSGTVIITGSVAGIYAIAFQGHYSASKFALEGYAGALKLELKEFGVKVAVIEPGDTKTDFTKERKTTEKSESPYYNRCMKSIAKMAHDEQTGDSPEAVAKVYWKVANKKNPRISYTTSFQYKFLIFLKRIFSKRFEYFVLGKMYL